MRLRRLFRHLYVQVLAAVALGLLVGALWPQLGAALKPLGDGFIKLIKMVVAPVIFCTVAGGIAHMRDMRAFGRLGLRTLVYFEAVSTLALGLGLLVGRTVQPGRGFNIDPKSLDASIGAGYAAKAAHEQGLVDYLLNLIPDAFFGAFAKGDLLLEIPVRFQAPPPPPAKRQRRVARNRLRPTGGALG